MFFVLGYQLALIEIFLFGISAWFLRLCTPLNEINGLVYYWVMFTILTGIWETFFVIHYPVVVDVAKGLLINKTHVWTQNYTSYDLNPSNFSQLFYAEYGAYADREYMDSKGEWSRVIESSHSLLCGAFCLLAVINYLFNNVAEFIFCLSVAMGSQLMNSILYMVNYIIQVNEPSSLNYNTTNFPSGKFLEKRPFMYINIFWTLMPVVIIFYLLELLRQKKQQERFQNRPLSGDIEENQEDNLPSYEFEINRQKVNEKKV